MLYINLENDLNLHMVIWEWACVPFIKCVFPRGNKRLRTSKED